MYLFSRCVCFGLFTGKNVSTFRLSHRSHIVFLYSSFLVWGKKEASFIPHNLSLYRERSRRGSINFMSTDQQELIHS